MSPTCSKNRAGLGDFITNELKLGAIFPRVGHALLSKIWVDCACVKSSEQFKFFTNLHLVALVSIDRLGKLESLIFFLFVCRPFNSILTVGSIQARNVGAF